MRRADHRRSGASALDAVHGATGCLPRVVGGTRPEAGLVPDDPRVPTYFLRTLCMPEQVRIVALLPDEHEVCRGHEVRDERAPFGRARERIRADAVPAAVVAVVVTGPQLLV